VITVLRNRITSTKGIQVIDKSWVKVFFCRMRVFKCEDYFEVNGDTPEIGFGKNKRIVK